MNTVLFKEMFSFQQGLNRKTFCLIVDSCQQLKKLSLLSDVQCDREQFVFDDDVIRVIKKLGKQLTTLAMEGRFITDVAFSIIFNNFAR
jgi:hypothetical protein